jgi:nicotinamide-nucleotide amidase
MIMEKYNSSFVFFPGVPIEMRSIFKTYFLPIIKKQLGGVAFEYYDVETIGISESKLSFLLSDIENNMPDNISLAYLPSLGHVLIRLYVKGIGMTMEAKKLKQKIIDLVGESVIGKGELEIEKWLINVLSKKRQMIAFAESCTGGKIASKLTALPGCSKIFKGSIVAYNDHIKSDILDVQYLSIEKHGSVSQQVVKEMLIGVIKKFKVDLGIAVSGIAGPDGGSHEKPIGTVWIGVGDRLNQKVELFRFKGNREQIIELVSITALNQLRKFILEIH